MENMKGAVSFVLQFYILFKLTQKTEEKHVLGNMGKQRFTKANK